MTDNPSTLPASVPPRQAAAIDGRSQRMKVTGKLKAALDAMVWDRLKYPDAAAKAGLAANSVRSALRKPHVIAYYRAERMALLASIQPRNIHRLDDIADKSANDMAKVAAIKQLEAMDQVAAASVPFGAGPLVPGLVIVIEGAGKPTVIVPSPPRAVSASVRSTDNSLD